MNKSELTRKIAAQAGLTQKQAGAALDSMMDAVQNTVADGQKLALIGLGTFEVKKSTRRKRPAIPVPVKPSPSRQGLCLFLSPARRLRKRSRRTERSYLQTGTASHNCLGFPFQASAVRPSGTKNRFKCAETAPGGEGSASQYKTGFPRKGSPVLFCFERSDSCFSSPHPGYRRTSSRVFC